MWFLFFACHAIGEQREATPLCDPRELSETEVRLRPYLCGDEKIKEGSLRRGDWIFENNFLRIGLRAIGSSLSSLEGKGSSIIDIAMTSGKDSVLEIFPFQNEIVDIEAWNVHETAATIEIEFVPFDSGIRLTANQDKLEFFGSLDWLLHPNIGSEQVGQTLILSNQNNLLLSDADWLEVGSQFILENPSLLALSPIESAFTLLGETVFIEGQTNGEALRLWKEEELIGKLPTPDSRFQFDIPAEVTTIQATKEGCLPSEKQSAVDNIALLVGECGSISIRLEDQGTGITGNLILDEQSFFIPKQGLVLPFANTVNDATIELGVGFEPIHLGEIDPLMHPVFERSVERAIPDVAHLSLLRPIWPDPNSNVSSAQAQQTAIGEHIDYTLLTAQDRLPLYSEKLAPQLQASIDSSLALLSSHPMGDLLSWPWSPNKNAGFGALEFSSLSLEQAITFAGQKNRNVALSYSAFLQMTEPEYSEKSPDFLWLQTQEDTLHFAKNCSSTPYSRPIAQHTWFPSFANTDHPSKMEMEQELRRKNIATGTGPYLHVEQQISSPRTTRLQITLITTRTRPLDQLLIFDADGLIAEWEITDSYWEKNLFLNQSSVFCVVAISESQENWVIHSPLWPALD